ncbi:MAG: 2-oxo acid dehydrogenase subunit E2 [Bdellovibrionales bacterium]|nr:2-oxo acid dehydrogenase subunit E2 [Bdellovibrionales bacterium]
MSLLRRNVQLGPRLKSSSWRKVAIGTWADAKDPSVYGTLEVEVDATLAYLEKLRAETGTKVTLTHFVGIAVARCIRENPSINRLQRWGGLYQRKNVDVFFQVATDPDGNDLSGTVIREADRLTSSALAKQLEERASAIRTKGDGDYKKMKGTIGMLPGWFVGKFLDIGSFLLYGLNLWGSWLGSPRDSFGSVMVTSIGSLGLDLAFAPLVPYSRCPMVIAVGAAQKRPVVQGDQVKVANVMRICCTFDHRLIDGVHAAKMTKFLKEFFANPELDRKV